MSNLDGLLSDRCLIYLFNFHFFLCVCLYVVLCLVPCVVCCVLCVVLCGRSAHSVRRRRVRDARRRDERVPLGAARTVGRDRADDQGIRPQTEVAHTQHSLAYYTLHQTPATHSTHHSLHLHWTSASASLPTIINYLLLLSASPLPLLSSMLLTGRLWMLSLLSSLFSVHRTLHHGTNLSKQ